MKECRIQCYSDRESAGYKSARVPRGSLGDRGPQFIGGLFSSLRTVEKKLFLILMLWSFCIFFPRGEERKEKEMTRVKMVRDNVGCFPEAALSVHGVDKGGEGGCFVRWTVLWSQLFVIFCGLGQSSPLLSCDAHRQMVSMMHRWEMLKQAVPSWSSEVL